MNPTQKPVKGKDPTPQAEMLREAAAALRRHIGDEGEVLRLMDHLEAPANIGDAKVDLAGLTASAFRAAKPKPDDLTYLKDRVCELEGPMADAKVLAITARLLVDQSMTGDRKKADAQGYHKILLSSDEWEAIIWAVTETAYTVERLRSDLYGVINCAMKLQKSA